MSTHHFLVFCWIERHWKKLRHSMSITFNHECRYCNFLPRTYSLDSIIRALVLVLNSKHIYSICLNLINSIATWHSKKLIHLMHWTNLFQCNEKYLHFHLPAWHMRVGWILKCASISLHQQTSTTILGFCWWLQWRFTYTF